MKLFYTALRPLLFMVITLGGLQLKGQNIQVLGSNFPSLPATSCTNTFVDVNVLLLCINAAHNGNTVNVSGSTITIELDYTLGPICLGAIANTFQNVNLGMLAAGNYTVVMNGVLNGTTVSTTSTALSVNSCCTAVPSFASSQDTICVGDSIYFNNTSTGATSQNWYENNASVSVSQNFGRRYNTAGIYAIKLVVAALGCTDSITKSFFVANPPTVNLGPDLDICPGTNLLLFAGSNPDSVRWNDLSTGQTLSVNSPGTYFVKVYKNGCSNGDTVTVGLTSVQPVNLGNDTTICFEDTLLLNVTQPGASYIWQDASTKGTFAVTHAGTYSVTVTDSNGCAWKDTLLVTMDTCFAGLGENKLGPSISVYPNPASGQVRLSSNSTGMEECHLELYDLRGRLIFGQTTVLNNGRSAPVDLSQAKPGMYILRIKSVAGSFSQMLVKE